MRIITPLLLITISLFGCSVQNTANNTNPDTIVHLKLAQYLGKYQIDSPVDESDRTGVVEHNFYANGTGNLSLVSAGSDGSITRLNLINTTIHTDRIEFDSWEIHSNWSIKTENQSFSLTGARSDKLPKTTKLNVGDSSRIVGAGLSNPESQLVSLPIIELRIAKIFPLKNSK